MRNPFRRRKCCEVPFVCGHLKPGGAVSGFAHVEGVDIEFIGVVHGDGVDEEEVSRVLGVAQAIVSNNMDRLAPLDPDGYRPDGTHHSEGNQ